MFTGAYEIPEKIPLEALFTPLLAASDSISRFDERLKFSPLREALLHRLLYSEACAAQLAEGDLIHIEDLVMLDGRVYAGKPAVTLSSGLYMLRTWRRAQDGDPFELLRAARPGEVPLAPEDHETETGPVDQPSACDPDRLLSWRLVLRQTEKVSPLLAAAIVWDAWMTLLPDNFGAWRAPLLAALMLKSRGATTQFLLPIDTGRRYSPYRLMEGQNFETRIAGFLTWAHNASIHARKELKRLETSERLMRHAIKGHQKNARLPDLLHLFLSRPLVSIPLASKTLRISKQSVLKLIPRLGSHIQEVTGRKRYRAWAVT
jgi:hypothetical protein